MLAVVSIWLVETLRARISISWAVFLLSKPLLWRTSALPPPAQACSGVRIEKGGSVDSDAPLMSPSLAHCPVAPCCAEPKGPDFHPPPSQSPEDHTAGLPGRASFEVAYLELQEGNCPAGRGGQGGLSWGVQQNTSEPGHQVVGTGGTVCAAAAEGGVRGWWS